MIELFENNDIYIRQKVDLWKLEMKLSWKEF